MNLVLEQDVDKRLIYILFLLQNVSVYLNPAKTKFGPCVISLIISFLFSQSIVKTLIFVPNNLVI